MMRKNITKSKPQTKFDEKAFTIKQEFVCVANRHLVLFINSKCQPVEPLVEKSGKNNFVNTQFVKLNSNFRFYYIQKRINPADQFFAHTPNIKRILQRYNTALLGA